MQENQKIKKKYYYLILVSYPILYTLYIISQWLFDPTSFKYWIWIFVIHLIVVIISMIQIFRAKLKSAIILGMYPLSYIFLRMSLEFFMIGGHIHMTFGGNPPIQMYISILVLQPICVIGLMLINLIMMKAKERETYKDKNIHLDEKIYFHMENWGIHFIIGFALSYIMIYFLAGLFYQLFQ